MLLVKSLVNKETDTNKDDLESIDFFSGATLDSMVIRARNGLISSAVFAGNELDKVVSLD